MRMKTALILLLTISGLGLMSLTGSKNNNIAMFGLSPSRNMVSVETGVAEKWDVDSGQNILWSASLGSQTYAGPVVFGDKVFVGTNNESMKNPEIKGDHGNILTFNGSDGTFLWQAAHTKLAAGPVHDWPLQGVCSTPAIEGDRMFYTSNRCTIVCLDTEGFMDGENDGPVKNEKMNGKTDADIIWEFDMIGELDVFPRIQVESLSGKKRSSWGHFCTQHHGAACQRSELTETSRFLYEPDPQRNISAIRETLIQNLREVREIPFG